MLTKATHDVICRRGLPFYITMLTDGQAATLRQQDAIVRKSRSWVAQAVTVNGHATQKRPTPLRVGRRTLRQSASSQRQRTRQVLELVQRIAVRKVDPDQHRFDPRLLAGQCVLNRFPHGPNRRVITPGTTSCP